MKQKRFMKFLISGIAAAIVEYSVFLWLHSIVGDKMIIASQSVSFLCGLMVSFVLNKNWVFKSDGNIKNELARYLILALINLFLSNILIWLLTSEMYVIFWFAKFIAMASVAIWNYIIFQKIIFKNNNKDR